MNKDVTRANHIMNDLCTKNKLFSPITKKDFDLFNSFFKKEKNTYGNSWTYVTQGMYGVGPEGLGYKYYDGKNLSPVCIYPKIDNPELNVFYWVRPMGRGIFDIINTFAHSLLQNEHLPTYVKKIFPDQFDYLQRKGFSDTSQFPWHTSCLSEDDTYPEQIFDVKNTIHCAETLGRKENIRKNYLRSLKITTDYHIEYRKTDYKKNAWEITQTFFSTYVKKPSNLSSIYDYNNVIFSNVKSPLLFNDIVFCNNEPVGFYSGEYSQDNLFLSLYATIVFRKINYLTDSVMFHIFKTCKAPYINMGGSEDEGIQNHKLKYKPSSSQQMKWAALY